MSSKSCTGMSRIADGDGRLMTGVILTGGKSSRMGQEKALMPVGGVPVFRRILDLFEKLFDEVLIVTDREGRFAGYGCREVVDLIPDCGPLGGVYTGLHYAGSSPVFAVSCDLPFVHVSAVELIMKEAAVHDIVVPDIHGRLHPLHATYSRRCMPYLLERIGDNRLNITGFVNEMGGEMGGEMQGLSIKRVSAGEWVKEDPEFRSLFNMNTIDDWNEANELAEAGRRDKPCAQSKRH